MSRSSRRAVGHHGGGQREMRAAHADATAQTRLRQQIVDHAACARVGRRGRDMLAGEVFVHRPAPAHHRVPVGHQAHDLVLEQASDVQVGGRRQPVAHHQIDLAGGQALAIVGVGGERQDFDAGQGRGPLDVGYQQRQELRIEVIAGRHPEDPLGRGRLEARTGMPREQALGGRQHVRCRCKQRPRGVGRHHRAAGAHQDGVTGELAQARERRAHRRLVHAQAQSRLRNAVSQEQGVEDLDQVKIYPAQTMFICHTEYFIDLIR